MSGLGGVLYFEPRAVEHGLLERLDQQLAHLGPDGGRLLRHTSIGFVHRAFHTTLEARSERQPHEEDGLIVCLDGRLDNRADLGLALGLVHTSASDVELIATSYRRWGRDSFRRLEGDFAIVIWDTRERSLLLVRDPFGVGRLFYHLDRHRILWASTPDALLDLPGVPDDPNDDYVGEFLTMIPSASQSAFTSITPVLPGRGLIVRNQSVAAFTHWDVRDVPAADDRDRGTDTASTVERFKTLLTDAVRVRLRADRPVVAELSGGFDSSSIVCVADTIARDSGGTVPAVTSLSHIYDRGLVGEDGYYINAVEQQRQRIGLHISEEDDPMFGPWPDPDFLAFPRRFLVTGRTLGRGRAMQQAGARVVLNGFLGDELLGQQPGPRDAGRLVRRGRWLRAFNLCREFSLQRDRPALALFTSYGIRPNLPLALRRSLYHIPGWVNPEFAQRHRFSARLKERTLGNLPSHLAVSLFRAPDLLSGLDHLGAEGTTAPTRAVCVEMRYPYAHRPLVEFLLSCSPSQIYGVAQTRWLQRTALPGVLPDVVRTRTGKAGPSQVICEAIERRWNYLQDMLRDSRACARGYVTKEAVQAELVRWRHGSIKRYGDVLKFVALEMWLQSLERRTRVPIQALMRPAHVDEGDHAHCH
jgi:asparagine synthase (glutamine-hydrolysing)